MIAYTIGFIFGCLAMIAVYIYLHFNDIVKSQLPWNSHYLRENPHARYEQSGLKDEDLYDDKGNLKGKKENPDAREMGRRI